MLQNHQGDSLDIVVPEDSIEPEQWELEYTITAMPSMRRECGIPYLVQVRQ